MQKYLLLFALFLAPPPASAAPAMTSSVCAFTATVSDVVLREHVYNEDLRASYRLPASITYTDVHLDIVSEEVVEKGFGDGCSLTGGLPQILQLRSGEAVPEKGQCLRGHARFSGAEFKIGHWMYDLQVLDAAACARP